MSDSVENKVVRMGIDHEKFDQGVDKAIKKIESLNDSLNGLGGASKASSAFEKILSRFDFSNILTGAAKAGEGFTNMQLIGLSAMDALTRKAVDLGVSLAQNIGNKLIGPMKEGFGEYQTQMGAVQTVLTNTADKGTKIEDVNKAFAELNTYADKTIYNFAEMTRNIGTFTAAGVDLEKSTTAIKGIANLAAGSGSSSQQASTAMYQLSQALAAGTVKLQDWNSVVNAGMGGQLFQNELKKTAKQYGIDVDSLIEKNGSFRESLQEGWITSDILIDTLNRFADESTDIGKRLTAAATEVKTFGELFDSMGESVGSGWARLWQTIVGDYDEAKQVLTEIFLGFDKVVGGMFEGINNTASEWKELGGRTKLIDALRIAIKNAWTVITTVKEAFASIFPQKTGKDLADLTNRFYDFVVKAAPTHDVLLNIGTAARGVGGAILLFKKAFNGITFLMPVFEKMSSYITTLIKNTSGWVYQLSQSNLISDQIILVWNAFSSVIDSLRGVFEEVFPTDTASLFSTITTIIIRSLKQLANVLIENKENIANIFRAVLNVEKGVLRFIGIVVSNISKNEILPKIISLLGRVGGLIASIINKILQSKTVISIVNGAISFTSTVIGKVLDVALAIFDGFGKFKESIKNLLGIKIGKNVEEVNGKLSEAGNNLGKIADTTNNVSGIFGKLGEVFNKVKDSIVNFINSIFGKNVMGSTEEDGKKAATAVKQTGEAVEKVAGPLEKVKEFFSSLPEKILNAWNKLKDNFGPIVSNIIGLVKGLFSTLLGFVRQLTFYDLGKIFTTIMGAKLSFNTGGILKSLKQAIGGLGGLFESLGEGAEMLGKSLSGLFNNLGKAVKNFGKLAAAKALKEIAISVAILAAALFVLSLLDIQSLGPALGVLTGLLAEMIAVIAILGKISKGFGSTIAITLSAISGVFLSLGVSVMLLSLSLKLLSTIPTENLIAAGAALVILMSAMTAMAIALSTIANEYKDGSKMMKAFGSMMLKMAAAILIMSLALKILAGIDQQALGTAVIAVIALMATMTVVVKELAKSEKMSKGISKTIIALTAAILILAIAIKIISNIETDKLALSVGIIIALLGTMTYMVSTLSKIKKVSGVSGVLVVLAGTMLILSIVLKSLSKIQTDKLLISMLSLVAILAVLVILIYTLSQIKGNSKKLASMAGIIASMAGVFITIGIAFKMLKDLKTEQIVVGALALTAVFASVILMMGIANKISTKSVLGLSLLLPAAAFAIMGIALALKILGKVPIQNLLVGAIAISALLVVLGLMGKMMDIKSMALLGPMLLTAGAGIMAFAMAIAILAVIPYSKLIVGFIAIAVIFAAIIVVCKFMKPLIGTLVAFSGALIVMAAAMALTAISLFIFTAALSLLGSSLLPLLYQISGALIILAQLAPEMARNLSTILEGVLPEMDKQFKMLITFVLNNLAFLLQELANKVPDMVASLITMAENVLFEIQKNNRIGNIIKNAFNILWQIIEGLIESLTDHTPKLTHDIMQWIITSLQSLHNELQTNGDKVARGIADVVADLLELCIKAIYHLFERLAELGTWLGNKIGEGIKKAAPELKKKFIEPIKNGVKWIKDRFNDFLSLGRNIINNIKKGVVKVATTLYNKIIEPALNAIKKFGELVSEAWQCGWNFIQGFIDGCKAIGEKAVEGITWIGTKVVEGWQIILGEHSPSVIAKQSGIYWIQGFLNGLTRMRPELDKNVDGLASSIVDGLANLETDIPNDMSLGDYAYTITPIIDMNTAARDLSSISSMLSTIDGSFISSGFKTPNISLYNNEERVLNVNNQDVVAAVNKLNNRLNDIQKHIDNLQIYLDSGALIGEIKDPLNKEFGRMVTQSKRRKV